MLLTSLIAFLFKEANNTEQIPVLMKHFNRGEGFFKSTQINKINAHCDVMKDKIRQWESTWGGSNI